MGSDISIKIGWSNEVPVDMSQDFLDIENQVFGGFFTQSLFERKYSNNIYGPSVLVVAYREGKPVGADALWRNDVMGTKAYQSADTCVLKSCRGMGVFTKMVDAKLSFIQSDSLVYGFPNSNSLPGFVKMGWSVVKLYKTLSFVSMPKEKCCIEDSYCGWWFQPRPEITYMKRQGNYYLVRKQKGKQVGTILGKVERKTALLFNKTSRMVPLIYFSPRPSFYNKSKFISVIFAKDSNTLDVPYWKIDAI